MTPAQIYSLIRTNKCNVILLKDYSGNKLHEILEKTPEAAILALENDIEKFAGYRKLEVVASENETTKMANRLSWQLEFLPDQIGNKNSVQQSVSTSSSDNKYIDMLERMYNTKFESEKNNLALQKEMFEIKMKMEQNDPIKWLPMIQAVGPALGFNISTGIQGPPRTAVTEAKNDLHFEDVEFSKLTSEQMAEKVGEQLTPLAGKISGAKLHKVLALLNSIEKVDEQIDKIILLLNAMKKNPALLDTAIKFVS